MQIGVGISLTGGGSRYAYSAEALTAFAAMSTPPSDPLKRLYDACIRSLKSSGVWTLLDALYLMNVETAQAARLNLKNPGTYNLTATNSPTFTAKVGYAGDGVSAHLDTNFNPATATTPNFVRNSASYLGWGLKAGIDTGALLGSTGAGNSYIFPRFTGSVIGAVLNSATEVAPASADGTGLWHNTRSDGTTLTVYRNGASYGSGASTSAAPASTNLALLRNSSAFYNGGISMAAIGSGMTAQQAGDTYTALSAFNTGVAAL